MKFIQNYTVRWHDTNANREITPTAILMIMQETSNKHLQTMYSDVEYIRDVLHQAFILSKIYLRIHQPAYAYDEITVETWTGIESRGYTFYRSYAVKNGDEVIADALTTWALIDTEDRKLVPVSKFENNFEDEPSLEVDMPRRIRFPVDSPLEKVGDRKIVYSDIDYNKHMNNTHYPSMLIDFLPSPEHYKVKEIMLSFIQGALYNDVIKVLRAQEGDTFYFRTLNHEDKTCLEAFMKTEIQNDEIK